MDLSHPFCVEARPTPSDVITVMHSLLLAMEADRVLVLSDGRLAEQGSHQELLTTGTLYSRLWQQQGMG